MSSPLCRPLFEIDLASGQHVEAAPRSNPIFAAEHHPLIAGGSKSTAKTRRGDVALAALDAGAKRCSPAMSTPVRHAL
ncbi:hypothetical protein QP166_01740 [Sphingomonas sp. LR60]|uniref:hypothetical protein n=1 Tax=Sphingomonas sp. LR60 TaxID=3050233 RepID=UPI002FDF3C73